MSRMARTPPCQALAAVSLMTLLIILDWSMIGRKVMSAGRVFLSVSSSALTASPTMAVLAPERLLTRRNTPFLPVDPADVARLLEGVRTSATSRT